MNLKTSLMTNQNSFISHNEPLHPKFIVIINYLKKLLLGNIDDPETKADYFGYTPWQTNQVPDSFNGNPFAYHIINNLKLLINNDMISSLGKQIQMVDHVAELVEEFLQTVVLDENTKKIQNYKYQIHYHRSDLETLYCLLTCSLHGNYLNFLFHIDSTSIRLSLTSIFATIQFNINVNIWSPDEEGAYKKFSEVNGHDFKVESDQSDDDYWSRYQDEGQVKQQETENEIKKEKDFLIQQERSNEKGFSIFSGLADEMLSHLYNIANENGISSEKCENILLEKIVKLTRKDWNET